MKGNRVGTPVAIKDTWVDADRKGEADILLAMKEDIRKTAPDITDHDVAKFFLSVRSHGVVMIDGKEDRTAELIMGGYTIPEKCDRFYLAKSETSLNLLGTTGGPPSLRLMAGAVSHYRYHPKVHYRCVFNEVGTPLSQVGNTEDTFKVLSDVVRGG
jgi:hypothetical protein